MHPLQNGSQATARPANKPTVGLGGWFTESGDNNVPSYPGADWFNHVIAEFQNAMTAQGVPFDPNSDDHLSQMLSPVSNIWIEGTVVTDPNKSFKYFSGADVGVEYHAPLASAENPIVLGPSPDDNFELYIKGAKVKYQQTAVSAAIQQVIRLSIQDKLESLISVKDWGAIGDGNSHPVSEMFSGLAAAQLAFPHVTSMDDELDWAAIQGCVDSGRKLVSFDITANYHLNRPVKYDTQSTFYSPVPAITYGAVRTTSFIISRETWDGSDAIFSKRNRDSSYQSIIFDGLEFNGYADIVYNDLSSAEDIGVHAIDASYIRDGLVVTNCSFNRISSGIKQISAAGYLGFTVVDKCHFTRCYLPIDCKPTTRLSVTNTRIYDCYDWINTNKVYLQNVSFNNSSFSSENCGIHAEDIHSVSCWYEGGNRWFDTSAATDSARVKVDGGFMSEAYSASGSTKFIANPSRSVPVSYSFSGNIKFPENTRLFTGVLSSDWSMLSLYLYNCSNLSTLWCGENTSLDQLLRRGMSYEGEQNLARSGYTEPHLNSIYKFGACVYDEFGVTPRLTTTTGITLTVTVDNARASSQFSDDRNAFVTINCVGNSNGAGGTQIYALQFTLLHGYGTNWTLCEGFSSAGTLVNSLTINGFVISINNLTQTTCELTITPTHSGTKSGTNWFVTTKSANIHITE